MKSGSSIYKTLPSYFHDLHGTFKIHLCLGRVQKLTSTIQKQSLFVLGAGIYIFYTINVTCLAKVNLCPAHWRHGAALLLHNQIISVDSLNYDYCHPEASPGCFCCGEIILNIVTVLCDGRWKININIINNHVCPPQATQF